MTYEEHVQAIAAAIVHAHQDLDASRSVFGEHHATAVDFPGLLATALVTATAMLGDEVDALWVSRPGSWEATSLAKLVGGTVGHDGEYLADFRPV